MEESVILRGPVPSTGVLPVVQAIGIGRQTNVVELLDGANRVGQLSIRSGKVLSVDFGSATGLAALDGFVSYNGGTFVVRSVHGLPPREPIGDLRALLEQLGRDRDRISLMLDLSGGTPRASGTGVQAAPPGTGWSAPSPSPSPQPARLSSVPPPPGLADSVGSATPASAPAAGPVERGSASKPNATTPSGTILAIASSKGGVGKTTLTMNLGVALARRGLEVTIVDADPNGGVSAAVNAHRRITKGAFDVVCGAASISETLVTTRMHGLRVLPAGGISLSIEQVENAQGHRHAWRLLLTELARNADVVLVDTAGGMYGPTRAILSCATHLVGVLQAEPLAMRATGHFERAIAAVTPPPKLIGIVVNMLEPESTTSPAVLKEAREAVAPGLLFETSVLRMPIINDAALRGVVAGQGELTAPEVARTFEQLSAELLDRVRWSSTGTILEDSPLF
jgi:chromosome partitioning protein